MAEHILVAEESLGRPLKESEVVHHKDENKTNNCKDNLIVFKNNSDHILHHHGCPIKKEEDYYIADPSFNKKEALCKVCNKSFLSYIRSSSEFCSQECFKISCRVVERPSSEILEEKLREGNFSSVARHYGVSDNAIRKWCKSYGMSTKAKDYK